MATMDDKLMGEKLHYYCSSSEDEDDSAGVAQGPSRAPPSNGVNNTGPKGVVEDWQRYKQLETQQREEDAIEKFELAKKLSMMCRTTEDDERAKLEEEKTDAELEALLLDDDEAFFKKYMLQRMNEMETKVNSTKRFGHVIPLYDGQEFLCAIEKEEKSVVVVLYVYESGSEGCQKMGTFLKTIAKDYPLVKFLEIEASAVGFSKFFRDRGVPAILVYKGGDLVSSHPQMLENLGTDFYVSDVEGFLIENGVVIDKELIPPIIRGPTVVVDDDSD